MSKEMMSANKSVPATQEAVKNKIFEVFSEAVIKRATEIIRSYETETDAILFRKGICAIRNMLHRAEGLNLDKRSYEFTLIQEELRLHIRKVNSIVMSLRGKRPEPSITERDKAIMSEIERATKNIFGNPNLSLGNVAPLLLEAAKDVMR
jgi:hypothetical protein